MAVTKAPCTKARRKKRRHSAAGNGSLHALVSAALALPGMSSQTLAQDYRVDDARIRYHHARYAESGKRMDVSVSQLSLTAPLAERYELGVNGIRDITSGASPVLNLPDRDGEAYQVLQSGASIRDRREVMEASVARYGDTSYLKVKLGRSTEDDYESDFASIQYSHDFNQKNTRVSAGIAYNRDSVWNTYNPLDPFTEPKNVRDKRQRDFTAGVSQLIDKFSSIEFSISHASQSGYLSDPYKKVYIAGQDIINTPSIVATFGGIDAVSDFLAAQGFSDIGEALKLAGIYSDSRPRDREQSNIVVRYRRYLSASDSALHLEYRHTLDEWDTDGRTLELQWSKNLAKGWIVTPALRYYSQHSARFYQVVFADMPANGYYSSDYRLAGFGALSGKIKLSKSLGDDWRIRLSYEYYDRRQDYEWNGQSEGAAFDDYHAQVIGFSIEKGPL